MNGGIGKPIDMTTTEARAVSRTASGLAGPAATALLLVGALVGAPANALTLGEMTIQSNLGEALRAQVQVLDLTPSESASLTVQPASAAAFQAARIEYNPALIGLQISVERRGASQAVLRITGNRPVNEPFLEVLLEASWAGGRLSRNYTVLLDPPPAAQRPPAPAPLAPQIAPAPVPAPPPVVAPAPATPRITPPAPAPVRAAPAPSPTPAPRRPVSAGGAPGQLTVRPGDTAGGIAARTKAPSVSLDQMLVAMLQSNPDAFISGNVNRLRSGAVLNVPTEAEASATPAPEARQIVIAQSRDFNEFRRRLASGAPNVASAAPQRQASGSVQTQVQDSLPAASTPDRLTLSKGTANAAAASAEAERVARAKQEADSAQRLAELSRNVDELNRLGTTAGSAATPATPPPAAAAVQETAPAAAVPPPAEPVPTPKPVAPAAPVKAVVPPPPIDTGGSFLDNSPFADPKMLGVVGLLVALVVSLVSYRVVRRRKGITSDSGFKDNKGPDSFFGANADLHGDAANGGPSTLATSYSPSQLDAGGEVDPIAEADVYLAYGRDLQAEDILKDALRSHPERTALHAKLAEIYAKRKDVAAFNTLAGDAHRLTGGVGADWDRIQSLGQELDPTNAMFRSAGAGPGAAAAFSAAAMAALAGETLANPPAPAAAVTGPVEPVSKPEPESTPEPAAAEQIDPVMDLAFDLDDPVVAPPPPEPVETPPSLDLDFGAFTPDSTAPAPKAAVRAEEDSEFDLDFNLDDFDMPAQATAANAPEPLPPLDMSAFSLDLDEPETAAPPELPTPTAATGTAASEPETDLPEVAPDDALATKLALADEFNAIGDVDGARHLIEEVISESSGSVREQARRMLAALQ